MKSKKEFEIRLNNKTNTDFMGKVSHFLGLKFQWNITPDSVSVHLSQEAFADRLIDDAGLLQASVTIKNIPFQSGTPVDFIQTIDLPRDNKLSLY